MQGPIIGTLHNENKSMRYQLYILLNIVYYWCASQSCAIYLRKVDLIYVGADSIILYNLWYCGIYLYKPSGKVFFGPLDFGLPARKQ